MGKANLSGVRIKTVREQKGLDQEDLAVALNIDFGVNLTQSDISEIERGIRGLKDIELDALARILSVNPTWLLRGNE